VSAPIRQKDRITELEAKIEALTKLLESQQIRGPVDETESPRSVSSLHSTKMPKTTISENTSKKRRIEAVSPNDDSLEHIVKDSSTDGSLEIDHLVPRDIQVQSFDRYRNEIQPRFPLAPLAATRDFNALRESYPVLLQTVIFAASQGMLSNDVQLVELPYKKAIFST